MIKRVIFIIILFLTCLRLSSTLVNAEPANMLYDPSADVYAEDWQASGDASIEEVEGNPCFVLRNGGTFAQDIYLLEDDAGKFLVLIGLVSRERINTYGSLTDLPYLYGYMIDKVETEDFSRASIDSYFNVSPDVYSYSGISENEWFVKGGIFLVPENTKIIRVFLKQASQQGVSHNGSAARFDDLGAFLFTSLTEAKSFFNEFHYQ